MALAAAVLAVQPVAPANADVTSDTGYGSASISLAPATTSGFPPGRGATVPVAATSSTPGLTFTYFKATVTVDGRPVASNVFVSPVQGLSYRRAWGRGIVGLADVTGSGIDSRSGSDESFFNKPVNAAVQGARVTFGVYYRSRLDLRRKGDRLTFTARARYLDAQDRSRAIRRATVEVLERGRWTTLRRVILGRDGVATFHRTTRARLRYRLVVPPTSVHGGKILRPTRRA